ncbi:MULTISPECIES: hypothetical protein [unclassified Erwinia]|uniref:hypothetical protein n=1 Tax=unclassified Erwinia TaxID=2622719 RepID=UPI001178839C|nr:MULTISPECIES: hypothetical protein [unclassified Erwinia]
MHFFEPFRTDVKDGDLIYGVREERSFLVRKNNLHNSQFPFYIDMYAVMPYEEEIQNTKPTSQFIPKAPDQDDFSEVIKQHEKYSRIIEDDCPSAINVARKCKGGLLWITGTQSDRHIHFILDRLNINQVVHKNHERDWENKRSKSITGCELRWIYRNRHNPNVINKVQFWKHQRPVCPPWETSASHDTPFPWVIATFLRQQRHKVWNDYRPKSLYPNNNDRKNRNVRCSIS